jgi:hypothetical protein
MWEDKAALDGSREVTDSIRSETTAEQHMEVLAVEECQWSLVSARPRSVDVPAGGQQNCPVMANRSAH